MNNADDDISDVTDDNLADGEEFSMRTDEQKCIYKLTLKCMSLFTKWSYFSTVNVTF